VGRVEEGEREIAVLDKDTKKVTLLQRLAEVMNDVKD